MAEQSLTAFDQHLTILGQEYAGRLTSLEEELLSLSAMNETQQVQIDSLTTSMQTLNDENNSLCEQILQHQTEIMDLQAAAAKRQQEIERLTLELDTATKWQNIYLDELKKERETKTQYSAQIETLSTQNSRLSTQIETLRQHNSESQSNHNKLTGLIAKFKTVFNLT